jgi:hypothetical protein
VLRALIDREKRIEDLVCRFPTLFDIPDGHRLFRQHQYPDGSQADVVFRWPSSSLVVEVKKDPVAVKHLKQLRRYLMAERDERRIVDVQGLLLARISTKTETVAKAIEDRSSRIAVKYMESDFMLQVNYCRNCSSPFWPGATECPHCRSAGYVTIDFGQNRDNRLPLAFT